MLFRRVILMFRKVVYCSGGLYSVQEGYMDVQEGNILKKLIMFLVATNVVASQPPECRPSGMPTARAKNMSKFKL